MGLMANIFVDSEMQVNCINIDDNNIMFSYPHPLNNEGAGRVKTDPVNEERIQKVLNRYSEWLMITKGVALDYPITKQQVTKGQIIYPLVGYAIGLLSSYAFVHPSSQYIGKCFIAGTTFFGWWFAQRYQKSYNSHRYFYNFPTYPTDIQKMIDNNDARYSFRWLKDDYLGIKQA